MASKLTKAIYALLSTDKPVTPAGACYLLRWWDMPPVISEAMESLDWLTRNGYAVRNPDNGFGPEYLKTERT